MPNKRPENPPGEETRQALLFAAEQHLLDRPGSDLDFSSLAQHVGVSRRTVFNHYPSRTELEAKVYAMWIADPLCRQIAGTPKQSGVADEIWRITMATDLFPLVVRLSGAAEAAESDYLRCRNAALLQSLTLSVRRVSTELSRKYPENGRVQTEMEVASFSGALAALYRVWLVRSRGMTEQASRRVWADLVTRLQPVESKKETGVLDS